MDTNEQQRSLTVTAAIAPLCLHLVIIIHRDLPLKQSKLYSLVIPFHTLITLITRILILVLF